MSLPIAPIVGSVLSAGLGVAQQASAASAQAAAAQAQQQAQITNIQRQQEAERQRHLAILKASQIQQDQVRLREQQQQEQLRRQRFLEQRKTRRERGTAKAVAATQGVSGLSVDALLRDFDVQNAFLQESILRQSQFVTLGAQTDISSIQAQAEEGVIPSPTPALAPVSRPSGLSLGLGIAGSVLDSGLFG